MSLLVVLSAVALSATGASGQTSGDLLLLRGQHLFVVTAAGADVRELTPPGLDVEGAAWSPDGRRVAIGANRHIWVMNGDGTGLRQVTRGDLSEGEPAWSPDGRRIAFSSARTGYEQVWVVSASGGPLHRVSHRRASCVSPAWSPNGRWIAYTCALGFHKIVVDRVGGTSDRVVVHSSGVVTEEDPVWTPDSRTLVFARGKGIYVDGVYQVGVGGRGLRRLLPQASEPAVSPDGRRLAFIRGDHLWIAQRDGSGAHAVTSGRVAEAQPDWRPR